MSVLKLIPSCCTQPSLACRTVTAQCFFYLCSWNPHKAHSWPLQHHWQVTTYSIVWLPYAQTFSCVTNIRFQEYFVPYMAWLHSQGCWQNSQVEDSQSYETIAKRYAMQSISVIILFVHCWRGSPLLYNHSCSSLGIASVASDVSTKLLKLLRMQWDKEEEANWQWTSHWKHYTWSVVQQFFDLQNIVSMNIFQPQLLKQFTQTVWYSFSTYLEGWTNNAICKRNCGWLGRTSTLR